MRLLRHEWEPAAPAAAATRREDKRPIDLAATILGLLLTVTWPPVVGVVIGAALWLWWGDAWWMKAGLVGGLLLGAFMSMGVLASSFLLQRVLAPAPAAAVAPTMPAMTTISYEPLDATARRSDVRIVPLRGHRTIDSVDARDIAWVCRGLSMGASHSMRAWLGRRTPSGETMDAHYWRACMKPLRASGIIVGVSSRRAGRVVTRDLASMLAVLGLDASDASLWEHDAAHVEG